MTTKLPYVVQIRNDFYDKVKQVKDDPEKVLREFYILYKKYEHEPDITSSLYPPDCNLQLTADLYKKLTGDELDRCYMPLTRLINYGCFDKGGFIDVYENAYGQGDVDVEEDEIDGRSYVIMASTGEYSFEEVQPITIIKSKAKAIQFIEELEKEPSAYYDVYFSSFVGGVPGNVDFYMKSVEIQD